MKYIAFFLILFMSTTCFATIDFTLEQRDNLDIIHTYLINKYPAFTGFNDDKVEGIDESIVVTELQTLNINQLKNDDPRRKKLKKLRNKLKAIGLDNEDLLTLKLYNDIPD